jgi:conjugative relaxase-like TrwC/TraI family protein
MDARERRLSGSCVRFVSASGCGSGVLTIGKLGASRGQLAYYEQQVAAGIEDYYAGRGEASGVWRGAGAHALGLDAAREVEREGFMALMHGQSPVDGSVLRAMGRSSTVAAIDLTFSAPKSVSVLFAVAQDDVSVALLLAHERAVEETLGYLEREGCWTRRGHAGSERVRGEGFIAAAYRHRMSRAGDPQLHTHVVVANLTRAGGRYTALDAHALYEHKSAAGAVYRAVLRTEVRERLPWVSWRAAGRGLFEIDGVPEAVLRHFSRRRAEIEERAAELVGTAAGGLSRDRMQGIALATRRPKDCGVDGPGWRERARARAAEHGFGQQELDRLAQREPVAATPPDLGAVAARLSGPEGLTGMHNTFARRHALAEIAGAFPHGATIGQLEDATNGYLADPSVRSLGASVEHDVRFTTEGLLACETAIVVGAGRRRGERCAIVPADLVDQVLARHQPALNDDQAAAIRAITSGGHGVDTVQALAGTGKTTMSGALAACYRQAGWRVIGVAPTGRAARELRDAAGIAAGTIHTLVGELDRAGGFPDRTVLIIDEAGMAPTRVSAALLAHAERGGAKVIAVGDPGQLASVQAGGWLAALARSHPGPELCEVMRQRDPAERRALEALHDGRADAYLEHKHDDISMHSTENGAVDSIVDQWQEAQREHGLHSAVMIACDNETREQLNAAARERLKQDGSLPARGVTVVRREFATGDRVIARRNDHRLDVDNGTLGTVIEIDSRSHRMLLQTDSGERRELDLIYVARHIEHAYALTGHGAQGATVSWAGVIGRPDEFTREWAYTALSRARLNTTLHIIAEQSARAHEREAYAPADQPRSADQLLEALQRALKRSEVEPLALEQHRLLDELAPPVDQPIRPALGALSGHNLEPLAPRRTGPHLGL